MEQEYGKGCEYVYMWPCVYVCVCTCALGFGVSSSYNSAGVKHPGYAWKVFSSFQMRLWVELVDQEEDKVLGLID